MDQPLISVLIPTRERANTLAYTIASALDQASSDFEVLVSDNASGDGTQDLLKSIMDPRLRSIRSENRLSMCDNYEFALDHARGTYVIIIGDDDAVIPGQVDFLLARLHSLTEPVIHMWPLHIYDWPEDGRSARATYVAPVLPESTLDLREKARRVVELGGWKYYELPSPYHSAVPRQVLTAIKARTGRVFHSTQPDVFTAMAIPAFCEKAVNLGRTVTFNGRSAKSNGLGFVKRSALPNIERFIREYGDYAFHPSLYDGVSAAANMIPDAVLKAKDLFPEIYGETTFGYSEMWAYIARLGFVSHSEVVLKSRKIREFHEMSNLVFVSYSAIHQFAALRRAFLNRAEASFGHRMVAAPDVHAFARSLATQPPRA